MSEFKTFLTFFEKSEKIKFFFMSLSFFFLAIIEAFGIALIFPVVGMFQNSNFINETQNDLILFITNLSNFINPNLDILISFTILFGLIYLFKTILSFVIQSYQINYVWNIQKKLENKLFKNYLFSPYELHIDRQSSNLLKNIIQETSKVGNTILSSAYLISSTATILMILALMFLIDPLISLASLLIFFLTNLFVFFNTRKLITKIGENRYDFNEKRIEFYSTGINNIKDIKVNEQENIFINLTKKFNEKYFNSEKKIDIINVLPILITEFVFIIGVIIILHYINLLSQNGINDFIPKLSVFVAASIKLIPSVNKAAIMINKIKYNFKAVNSIKFDLNLPLAKKATDKAKNLKLEEEIVIKDLNFKFNNGKQILDNVNLIIKKNTAICLYGPSGIGKSTLLDLMLGIIKPQSGDIYCDNHSIYESLGSWRKLVGFVPQNINIFEDTLERNITQNFRDEDVNKEKINEIIKLADLENFVNKLINNSKTIIREKGKNISGGQKQRIGIARALAKKPKILILDEPTTGLDLDSKKKIYSTLSKLKKNMTIIIVSHDLKDINFCDHFYSFDESKKIKEKFN